MAKSKAGVKMLPHRAEVEVLTPPAQIRFLRREVYGRLYLRNQLDCVPGQLCNCLIGAYRNEFPIKGEIMPYQLDILN